MDRLLKAAATDTIVVNFTHHRTDVPIILLGTLNPHVTKMTINQQADSEYISLFNIVSWEWQSIKASTITSWKVLDG
jgi:hypothetical protein